MPITKPTAAVAAAYAKIAEHQAGTNQPVWISLVPEDAAMAKARALEAHPEAASLPLYGKTFAVKDNIDAAGMDTTAACPKFAYRAEKSAFIVEVLESAGAILIGKTNMDQFATGLVGTRSPYGACASVYNANCISGGSSSGSAVAVALEMVDFSLGTDTAGSGRVPAAFNGIVGLKPSIGLFSVTGVVPACRTLDCVSVFARDLEVAGQVLAAGAKVDPADFLSRPWAPAKGAAWNPLRPRLGVLPEAQREFFGDGEAAKMYAAAIEQARAQGAAIVEFDYTPFRETANLLYSGPWVAERLAAVEAFAAEHEAEMEPTVAKIILGARKYSAVDTYRALYRLGDLSRKAQDVWDFVDSLLLPTAPTIFTHAEIAADPVGRNTQLGYYTNFVNLLNLSALAVPAGMRGDGLPFGVTFIAPAMAEESLLATAAHFAGGTAAMPARGHVDVAVVGAHLSGQPLNHQLTSRGAFLVETAKTAPEYRFYALPGSAPPKPGLRREPGFAGPGIEVEVWRMPEAEFGGFVALIPPPLGIGTVMLQNGKNVKCFIAEPYGLEGAQEITSYGGWRAYLAGQ